MYVESISSQVPQHYSHYRYLCMAALSERKWCPLQTLPYILSTVKLLSWIMEAQRQSPRADLQLRFGSPDHDSVVSMPEVAIDVLILHATV